MVLDTQEIIKALKYNDDNPDNKKCVICGSPVSSVRSDTCNRSHGSKLSHITRGWTVDKKCVSCGKIFAVKNKDRNYLKTCGNKECNAKHRNNLMSGDKNHQYGLKGELNSSFRGGRRTDTHGYVRVLKPDHPNADAQGYVKEHILVMTEILGRPLDTSIEVVHHKDGNKRNNKPNNLELMTKSTHITLHNKMNPRPRGEDGRFLKSEGD